MYSSEPLKAHTDKLEALIQQIGRLFDDPMIKDGVVQALDNKKPLIASGKQPGIMVFNDQRPVAFGVTELLAPNYGNMVMHALEHSAAVYLANTYAEQGFLKDNLLELVHYTEKEPYKDTFDKLGLHSNFRQRMGMLLNVEDWPFPECPADMHLGPFDEAVTKRTGEISYLAHQISNDQVGYVGLRTPAARAEIDDALIQNKRGKFNAPASMTLWHGHTIIGFISVIDIQCWGYQRVPWIFDVSIEPSYIGKGYGKFLIRECMARLADMQYPAIGLGVTVNNTRAVSLYEGLGYQVVEQFYEFTDQDIL